MSDCLFCRILRREIAARVVFEDDAVLAFEDINPQAPTHLLVIPRKHIAGLDEATPGDDALLGRLQRVAAQLAMERGIHATGYRTVLNVGRQAGQSVFHLHQHLLGGRDLRWPPG